MNDFIPATVQKYRSFANSLFVDIKRFANFVFAKV